MKKIETKTITRTFFILYLVMLTWAILLKFATPFSSITHIRSVNLIPLAGSAWYQGRLMTWEIRWNILLFIPLGTYLAMMAQRMPMIKK